MLLFTVPVVFIRRLRYRPTLRVAFPIFSSFFGKSSSLLSLITMSTLGACPLPFTSFFVAVAVALTSFFIAIAFALVSPFIIASLFLLLISTLVYFFQRRFLCLFVRVLYLNTYFSVFFRDKWYVIFLRFFPVILGMFTVLNN